MDGQALLLFAACRGPTTLNLCAIEVNAGSSGCGAVHSAPPRAACGLSPPARWPMPWRRAVPSGPGWRQKVLKASTKGSHLFGSNFLSPLFHCEIRAGFALLPNFGAFTAKSPSPADRDSLVEKGVERRSKACKPKVSAPALRHPRYSTVLPPGSVWSRRRFLIPLHIPNRT